MIRKLRKLIRKWRNAPNEQAESAAWDGGYEDGLADALNKASEWLDAINIPPMREARNFGPDDWEELANQFVQDARKVQGALQQLLWDAKE